MLREMKGVSQKEPGIFRRWFEDDYFELIVWYRDGEEDPLGFQLCYDRFGREHALTWKEGSGFTHDSVDQGEHPGQMKSTPVLMQNGPVPADDLKTRFSVESGEIDSAVTEYVMDRLKML